MRFVHRNGLPQQGTMYYTCTRLRPLMFWLAESEEEGGSRSLHQGAVVGRTTHWPVRWTLTRLCRGQSADSQKTTLDTAGKRKANEITHPTRAVRWNLPLGARATVWSRFGASACRGEGEPLRIILPLRQANKPREAASISGTLRLVRLMPGDRLKE
jgi:hypothetical protein